MKHRLILWITIAAAPVVWFANLEANFAISPRACTHIVPLLVSICAIAITLASAWFGWSQLSRARAAGEAPGALALGAAIINIGAAAVILAQAIPIFMLAGCR